MSNTMWPNIPPKDIASAIKETCFSGFDWEAEIDGYTVEQRVYNCWQRMHAIIIADEGNGQWFIDFVRKNTPSKEIYNDEAP